MKAATAAINERLAETAFSRQAPVFDGLYCNNTIINYKRDRVREHALRFLPADASILELNAGTGEDAIFFAKRGFKVHATDISAGMQEQLILKAECSGVDIEATSEKRRPRTVPLLRGEEGCVSHADQENYLSNNLLTHRRPSQQGSPARTGCITIEICSYTQLGQLQNKGPFDMVFSNFAGLNCTGELDKVLASLDELLKPGGVATLVILPKFCIWETLMMFKGKFRTAFRRFLSNNGRTAHVEGTYFKCWYYNPSYVIKAMRPNFELVGLEGLCSLVPPSYIENFAEKHPRLYNYLKVKEDRLKSTWPWKRIGDYYIVSMRKSLIKK